MPTCVYSYVYVQFKTVNSQLQKNHKISTVGVQNVRKTVTGAGQKYLKADYRCDIVVKRSLNGKNSHFPHEIAA